MENSLEGDFKEFDEVLRNTDLLIDESVQIYELESEKHSVIEELYNSLKEITEFLGFYVDLPASIFNEENDAKITLTPSLDVVIKKSNGKIEQKRLNEFSTKKIAEILKSSIMPIIQLCKEEKIVQNKNITFLKSVTKRMGKIQNINSQTNTSETSIDSSIQDSSKFMNHNLNQENTTDTQNTSEAS